MVSKSTTELSTVRTAGTVKTCVVRSQSYKWTRSWPTHAAFKVLPLQEGEKKMAQKHMLFLCFCKTLDNRTWYLRENCTQDIFCFVGEWKNKCPNQEKGKHLCTLTCTLHQESKHSIKLIHLIEVLAWGDEDASEGRVTGQVCVCVEGGVEALHCSL